MVIAAVITVRVGLHNVHCIFLYRLKRVLLSGSLTQVHRGDSNVLACVCLPVCEQVTRTTWADFHEIWGQSDIRLTASFSGQPGQAGTRKVKRIWMLIKQVMMGWQWQQLDHSHLARPYEIWGKGRLWTIEQVTDVLKG